MGEWAKMVEKYGDELPDWILELMGEKEGEMKLCGTCRDRDDCAAWEAVQNDWPKDLMEKFGCTCWEPEAVEFEAWISSAVVPERHGGGYITYHIEDVSKAWHFPGPARYGVRITPL